MPNDWHYAVVVGIDQYPDLDDGERNLRCPEIDANSVSKWLISSTGGDVPAKQVKLITRSHPGSRLPPAPPQDEIYLNVRDTVRKFRRDLLTISDPIARKNAWKQSRFYFYISGHGLDADGDDTVVIAADASRDYMGMHITTRGLLNALKKDHVFAELIVIADACREFTYSTILPAPFNFESKQHTYNTATGSRFFYASSSRTRKKSYEPKVGSDITNSFFTHSLLQALQHGGVSGKVDSLSLKKFLYNDVPALTEKHLKVAQHPEVDGDMDIVFVAGPAPGGQTVTLEIGPASRFAGTPAIDALIYADGQVQQRHAFNATSPTQHTASLPAGSYLIVPQAAAPTDAGIPLHTITVLGQPLNVSLP